MRPSEFKFEVGQGVIYKGEFCKIVSRWIFLPENYKGFGRKYKKGTRLYNVTGFGDIVPEYYLMKEWNLE